MKEYKIALDKILEVGKSLFSEKETLQQLDRSVEELVVVFGKLEIEGYSSEHARGAWVLIKNIRSCFSSGKSELIREDLLVLKSVLDRGLNLKVLHQSDAEGELFPALSYMLYGMRDDRDEERLQHLKKNSVQTEAEEKLRLRIEAQNTARRNKSKLGGQEYGVESLGGGMFSVQEGRGRIESFMDSSPLFPGQLTEVFPVDDEFSET